MLEPNLRLCDVPVTYGSQCEEKDIGQGFKKVKGQAPGQET